MDSRNLCYKPVSSWCSSCWMKDPRGGLPAYGGQSNTNTGKTWGESTNMPKIFFMKIKIGMWITFWKFPSFWWPSKSIQSSPRNYMSLLYILEWSHSNVCSPSKTKYCVVQDSAQISQSGPQEISFAFSFLEQSSFMIVLILLHTPIYKYFFQGLL